MDFVHSHLVTWNISHVDDMLFGVLFEMQQQIEGDVLDLLGDCTA